MTGKTGKRRAPSLEGLGPISKAIVEWIGALRNQNIRPKEISLPLEAFNMLLKEAQILNMFLWNEPKDFGKTGEVGQIFGMIVRVTTE